MDLNKYYVPLRKPTLKDRLWILTSETDEQWWTLYYLGAFHWYMLSCITGIPFDIMEYPLTILTVFKILYNDNQS